MRQSYMLYANRKMPISDTLHSSIQLIESLRTMQSKNVDDHQASREIVKLKMDRLENADAYCHYRKFVATAKMVNYLLRVPQTVF